MDISLFQRRSIKQVDNGILNRAKLHQYLKGHSLSFDPLDRCLSIGHRRSRPAVKWQPALRAWIPSSRLGCGAYPHCEGKTSSTGLKEGRCDGWTHLNKSKSLTNIPDDWRSNRIKPAKDKRQAGHPSAKPPPTPIRFVLTGEQQTYFLPITKPHQERFFSFILSESIRAFEALIFPNHQTYIEKFVLIHEKFHSG